MLHVIDHDRPRWGSNGKSVGLGEETKGFDVGTQTPQHLQGEREAFLAKPTVRWARKNQDVIDDPGDRFERKFFEVGNQGAHSA